MFRPLFLVLIFIISLPAFTAERVNLYRAEVQVESQLESDRNRAFQAALEQVIFKIIGDPELLEAEELKGMISQASRYVSGFSYSQNTHYREQDLDSSDVEPKQAPDYVPGALVSPAALPFLIQVEFDERSVMQRIRGLGLPIWGALRPTLLTWVVIQRGGDRSLLSSDTPDAQDALMKQADIAGLPIVMPVGDLQDLASVNLNELWGLFPSAVEGASLRYESDYRVLARVFESSSGLDLKWTLMTDAQQYSGRVTALDYDAMWREMSLQIVGFLAERFAVVSDPDVDAGTISVAVQGVYDFLSYANLLNHVDSLSSVESATVSAIEHAEVSLRVSLRGSRSSFEQQVALAGSLQPVLLEDSPDYLVGDATNESASSVYSGATQYNDSRVSGEFDGLTDNYLDSKEEAIDLRFFWKGNKGA